MIEMQKRSSDPINVGRKLVVVSSYIQQHSSFLVGFYFAIYLYDMIQIGSDFDTEMC